MTRKEFKELVDKAGCLSEKIKQLKAEYDEVSEQVRKHAFAYDGAGKYEGNKYIAVVSDVKIPDPIAPKVLFQLCEREKKLPGFFASVKVNITEAKEHLGPGIMGLLNYGSVDECSRVTFKKK